MALRKSYVDIFATRRNGVLTAKTSIGERAAEQSVTLAPQQKVIINDKSNTSI